MRIRHCAGAGTILRCPLMRTGRTLSQFPFILEQIFEVVVAPLRWRCSPDDFQPTADRVATFAGLEFAPPTQALLLDGCGFRLWADQGRITGPVSLAEGVATRDQRDRFFVIHRHAAEGFANIFCCGEWIRIAVRAFRIDVDQAHLHSAEGILKITLAAVALIGQPLAFWAPVDVILRLPYN